MVENEILAGRGGSCVIENAPKGINDDNLGTADVGRIWSDCKSENMYAWPAIKTKVALVLLLEVSFAQYRRGLIVGSLPHTNDSEKSVNHGFIALAIKKRSNLPMDKFQSGSKKMIATDGDEEWANPHRHSSVVKPEIAHQVSFNAHNLHERRWSVLLKDLEIKSWSAILTASTPRAYSRRTCIRAPNDEAHHGQTNMTTWSMVAMASP